MATEIEYKFLVRTDLFFEDVLTGDVKSKAIMQGYLSANPTVRVRVVNDGTNRSAFMTVKGKRTGISRDEYEFSIPEMDAHEMFGLCRSYISKIRYLVPHEGNTWEVDVFQGDNAGLVLAELEVPSESYKFAIPHWCIKDVSKSRKFTNSYLAEHPVRTWKKF